MRVIAGTKRGLQLRCGRGPVFRPTAQIVKGSIFDTLGDAVAGAVFVDLFAGSGAVGIEALSRGAKRAVFIEQDHRILKALRTNLQRCGFTHQEAEVKMGDAMRFLDKLINSGETVDVIFADPPYAGNLAQRIVRRIEEKGRMPFRLLVIEHGTAIFTKEDSVMETVRTKKFGQTLVSYFRFRDRTTDRKGVE
ncbi:MAG: 16S rRNA (guanine(966)-N(2))-methyltransferase RsmD [bacterium]|nr:MAG: 16S rRNA (guanine(966)-N(2))-methyltransferase RsmD [bacterium]